jgi:hypothetical protein
LPLGFSAALLLSIPQWGSLIGLKQADEQAAAGLGGGMRRHADLALNGYFKYWPDTRWATSSDARELFRYLQGLISCGSVTADSRVAHVSRELYPWSASPFPAFTGITQDLYLTQPFTPDIHVFQGRIRKLSDSFVELFDYDWILIEGKDPIHNKITASLLAGAKGYEVAYGRNGLVLLTHSARCSAAGAKHDEE